MKKTKSNKPTKSNITAKKEMFCREYLIDFNATKAAIRAGYSKKTSYSIGDRLLKNVEIQNRISHLKNNVAEALNISAITIATEHKKIAFVSGTQIWKDWMSMEEFDNLPESVKASISEVSSKTTSRIDDSGAQIVDVFLKVKLYDKQKALDSLAKMIGVAGLIKTEVSGIDGAPLLPTTILDLSNLSEDKLRKLLKAIE